MEKIGKILENCESCGAELVDHVDSTKELKIVVRHKKTGHTLATMWYTPPLCRKCGGEGSLSLDVEWLPANSDRCSP